MSSRVSQSRSWSKDQSSNETVHGQSRIARFCTSLFLTKCPNMIPLNPIMIHCTPASDPTPVSSSTAPSHPTRLESLPASISTGAALSSPHPAASARLETTSARTRASRRLPPAQTADPIRCAYLATSVPAPSPASRWAECARSSDRVPALCTCLPCGRCRRSRTASSPARRYSRART